MDELSNEQKQKDLVISNDELLFTLSQFIKLYQRGMYRARLPYVPYRGQNRVLKIIADNDGLSQKELAELLDIRSASTSELLNKLERSNLIIREKDKADKRITHVFLSDEGRKIANSSQSQGDFAEMIFGGLNEEEVYTLYTIMKKLCAIFEAQALLEGEDSKKPLPPHLKDGHMPPHPPEPRPLPPHLHKDSASGPPEEAPLPPHLKK